MESEILRAYVSHAKFVADECAIESVSAAVASIAALACGQPLHAARLAVASSRCAIAATVVRTATLTLEVEDGGGYFDMADMVERAQG